MNRLHRALIFAITLILLAGSATAEEPTWTWIHGQLADAEAQSKYLEFATKIHAGYQDYGIMLGTLVAEQECDPWPSDHVVFLGPIEAFDDPTRFGLPISINGKGVRVGAQSLEDENLGIFLMNEAETRVIYTGLSYQGFSEIFSVPTGDDRCTVTQSRGQILYSTSDLSESRNLDSLPFLPPYPSPQDVADLKLPAGALELSAATTTADLEALDPAFADWLDGFVEDQRVLFFGEGHWNRGVNKLFNLMVEHFLESGELSAVFLEANYSFSGYLNHYITESDPAIAHEILANRVHHMVVTDSTLQLLDILRTWNLDHPDRMVRVACLDMEWSWPKVVTNVIQPYFQQLDPDFAFAMRSDDFRQEMQEKLEQARERNLVGEYPFLTPDYMASVLTNLWDTQDIEDFNVDRQRGIIRNMTEFNGELLEDGFVMFKGGGWHAMKTKPENENFHRDAAWLHLEHPSTKGKVVTFMALGLGYNFRGLADIDLSQHMKSATNYNRFAKDFQKALSVGRAEPDSHYLLGSEQLSIFKRLIIQQAYARDLNVVHLSNVDWEALEAVWGDELNPREARYCDAAVFILRADMEVMRPIHFKK